MGIFSRKAKSRSGFSMELVGVSKLQKALDGMGKAAPRAFGAGCYALMNAVMTNAKRRAPKDTGTLRGSGYVTLPKIRGRTVYVEAGFGGPAKKYALRQHEETTWSHTEGEAKYLDNAVAQYAPRAMAIIGRYARKAFENGGANAEPMTGAFPTNPNSAPDRTRATKKKVAKAKEAAKAKLKARAKFKKQVRAVAKNTLRSVKKNAKLVAKQASKLGKRSKRRST